MERGLIERVRERRRASRSSTSSPPADDRVRGRRLMEAASITPTARPSRAAAGEPLLAGRAPAARDAAFHHLGDHGLRGLLHGLLLHPGRRRRRVAGRGHRAAEAHRGRQHRDPAVLVGDDALGARVGQEGQPLRPAGRHLHDLPARARRSCSSRSTSTSTSASPRRTTRRGRSSTGSPACTARTSSSASRCWRSSPSAPSAGTSRPRSTAASRCRASTGTSST